MNDAMLVPVVEEGKFIEAFEGNIRSCMSDLKEVSDGMNEIQEQGGWTAFWSKSKNIGSVAKHVDLMGAVLQKNLEISLLLMHGSANIRRDYDIIISLLNKVNEDYEDNVEVIEALGRFRQMVEDLKAREDLNDRIIGDVNDHTDKIIAINEHNSKIEYQINELRSSLDKSIENYDKMHDKHINELKDLKKWMDNLNTEWNDKLQKTKDKIEEFDTNTQATLEKTERSLSEMINTMSSSLKDKSDKFQSEITKDMKSNAQNQEQQLSEYKLKYDKALFINRIALGLLGVISIVALILNFV